MEKVTEFLKHFLPQVSASEEKGPKELRVAELKDHRMDKIQVVEVALQKEEKPEEKSGGGEEEGDDEDVDPIDTVRAQCLMDVPKIREYYDIYMECNKRVLKKTKTTETCVQELHDYFEHLDQCVIKRIFQVLK